MENQFQIICGCEFEWVKLKGDCSLCPGCEELIYGNKYTMGYRISIGCMIADHVELTEISVCESCKDLIDLSELTK